MNDFLSSISRRNWCIWFFVFIIYYLSYFKCLIVSCFLNFFLNIIILIKYLFMSVVLILFQSSRIAFDVKFYLVALFVFDLWFGGYGFFSFGGWISEWFSICFNFILFVFDCIFVFSCGIFIWCFRLVISFSLLIIRLIFFF